MPQCSVAQPKVDLGGPTQRFPTQGVPCQHGPISMNLRGPLQEGLQRSVRSFNGHPLDVSGQEQKPLCCLGVKEPMPSTEPEVVAWHQLSHGMHVWHTQAAMSQVLMKLGTARWVGSCGGLVSLHRSHSLCPSGSLQLDNAALLQPTADASRKPVSSLLPSTCSQAKAGFAT